MLTVDLSRSVVYLESNDAIPPVPTAPGPRTQIAQHGKAFVPDFLVVPAGTSVEFPNFDPFTHNVFSRSRAAAFDSRTLWAGTFEVVHVRERWRRTDFL